MRILINKEQIDSLEDVTYDLIFSIKKGLFYINYLFKENNVFLRPYTEVINYMITGFYSPEYDLNNLLNKDMFLNLLHIHFALVNYENDYYKIKNDYLYSKHLRILENVRVLLIDQDYYLDIKDEIINDLLFYLKSYLGIVKKDKSKFIKFYNKFYAFNKQQKNFDTYLEQYFSYLGEIRKKDNYKLMRKLYENIKHEIKLSMMSDEEKEKMEKSITEIKHLVDNSLLKLYWELGKDVNDSKKNNISDYEHYKNKASEYREWFGRGYNVEFVKLIHKYYLCYPYIECINPKLNWEHYKLLVSINNDGLRKYYQNLAIKNNWDVTKLKNELNLVNLKTKKNS